MKKQDLLRKLRARYPLMKRESDGLFYYSLGYRGAGETVAWEGTIYTVIDGWLWLTLNEGISIYCAKVEEL